MVLLDGPDSLFEHKSNAGRGGRAQCAHLHHFHDVLRRFPHHHSWDQERGTRIATPFYFLLFSRARNAESRDTRFLADLATRTRARLLIHKLQCTCIHNTRLCMRNAPKESCCFATGTHSSRAGVVLIEVIRRAEMQLRGEGIENAVKVAARFISRSETRLFDIARGLPAIQS